MSSVTDIGVIAARCGGRVPAVKSWVMPEKEMPAIPTLPPLTQRLRARRVSTAS